MIPPMKPLRGTALKRFLKGFERPALDLALVLQDVEDPGNVGSAFRIADALEVTSLVLTGISVRPPHQMIDRVGRRKDRRVKWTYVEDPVAALRALRAEGYFLCAVELTGRAVPYFARAYPAKTCLIVGHERHGVTKKVLRVTDAQVYIPMYGMGASLNVSVALAVASFHVLHGAAASSGGSYGHPETGAALGPFEVFRPAGGPGN